MQNEPISVSFAGKKAVLTDDVYLFNISESVRNAVSGKRSSLLTDVDEEALKKAVNTAAGKLGSKIKIDALKKDILTNASQLSGNQTLSLEAYTEGSSGTVIYETTIPNAKSSSNLVSAVNNHPSTVIKAQSQLSVLEAFGKDAIEDEEALSKLASAVYKTILGTNFDVIERHTGLTVPSAEDLGYEAKIEPGYLDFKIFNPNDTDYKLTFDWLGNTLHVAVVGKPLIYQYDVVRSSPETFGFKKIVRYDAAFSEGQEKTVQTGKNGYLIKVYRNKDGDQSNTAPFAEDFYPPVHQIVARALTPSEKTDTQTATPLPDQQTLINSAIQQQIVDYYIKNGVMPGTQGTPATPGTSAQDPAQTQQPDAAQENSETQPADSSAEAGRQPENATQPAQADPSLNGTAAENGQKNPDHNADDKIVQNEK
nr:VanW family protein [Metabacillus kandeliae]